MQSIKIWWICRVWGKDLNYKIATLVVAALIFSGLLLLDSRYNFSDHTSIYNDLHLKTKLNLSIFKKALEGKRKHCKYTNLISIIDFTQPSTSKRFFLIDLRKRKILYHTYVAHGKNSGENYATKFSNKEDSHMSSIGFYKTGSTYYGKHGYSLRLHGLEEGLNDNAFKRAIVIHGADYVSEDFIKKQGRLGRSHGCPALPKGLVKNIITITKGGSCLYIHYEKN